MKNLLIAGALLAFSGLAHSATIDFNSATASSSSLTRYTEQGVTFTAQGGSAIQIRDNGPSGSNSLRLSSVTPGTSFIRVDFGSAPASSVSLDIGDNNSSDTDRFSLRAFNSAGQQIDPSGAPSTGFDTVAFSSTGFLSVTSTAADIAWVAIALTSGAGNFFVDNLNFDTTTPPSAVPIPAAAILFAPALLGFMGLRRRVKKQA